MGVEKNPDGSYKAVRHDYLGRLIYGDELFDPEIDHEDANGNRVYRCRRGVLLEYGIRITKNGNDDVQVPIADFGKHNIILFNSHFSSNYHQEVYSEFNAVLDYISYQYMLTMGRLPRYNLVAHSRGGVVNAMYTIEHPYSVASLVSIDTPYYGIAIGELSSAPNMPDQILNMAGGVLGSGGAEDFLNPYYQDWMRNSWNDMMASHPDANINAHAIGSAASESYLYEILFDPAYNAELLYNELFKLIGVTQHLDEYKEFLKGFVATFLNGILRPQSEYAHVYRALNGLAQHTIASFLDFFGIMEYNDVFNTQEDRSYYGGQLVAELLLGVASGFLSNTFLYKMMSAVLPALLPLIIGVAVPDAVYLVTQILEAFNVGNIHAFGGFLANSVASELAFILYLPLTILTAVGQNYLEENFGQYREAAVYSINLIRSLLDYDFFDSQEFNLFGGEGFTYKENEIVIRDDLFIDLESQTATGFNGIEKHVKVYAADQYGNTNFNKPPLYLNGDGDVKGIEGLLSLHDALSDTHTVALVAELLEADSYAMPSQLYTFTNVGGDSVSAAFKASGVSFLAGKTARNIELASINSVINIGQLDGYAMAPVLPEKYAGKTVTGINTGNMAVTVGYETAELDLTLGFGASAAWSAELNKYVLGASVKAVGAYIKGEGAFGGYIFAGSGIENLTLFGGLTYIPDAAFSGCTELTGVITLPAALTYFGQGAFFGCRGISGYGISADNLNYKTQGGLLYNKNMTELVSYPAGKADTAFTVPGGVTRLSAYFASGNTYLENVDTNDILIIADGAFSGCSNLTDITLASAYQLVVLEGGNVFSGAPLSSVSVPAPYISGYSADPAWAGFPLEIYVTEITFDSLGGNLLASAQAGLYGGIELPIPVRAGYDFVGWYMDTEAGRVYFYLPENASASYTADWFMRIRTAELKAVWDYATFLLNYSGAVAPNGKAVTYLHEVGVLPEPQRAGEAFLGWYTQPNGQGAEYTQNKLYDRTEDTVLYAYFVYITYTITYSGGGAAGNPSVYQIGQSFILLAPALNYYTFAGWYYGSDKITNIIQLGTGNKTLTAAWTPVAYTLTFSPDGGTLGDKAAYYNGFNVTYQNTGSVIKLIYSAASASFPLPTPVKGGYKGKWNSSGSLSEFGASYSPAAPVNRSYTAVWTVKTFAECGGEIYFASQLAGMTGTSNAQLMQDIALSGEWTPLPLLSARFSGNGHKITGLRINRSVSGTVSSDVHLGLFSGILLGGSVSDLILENVNIYYISYGNAGNGWSYVGGVAGFLRYGAVENVTVTGLIENHRGRSSAGGIVGHGVGEGAQGRGSIRSCSASVTVHGDGDVGGIIGGSDGLKIIAVTVKNSVLSLYVNGANRSIGGIIGYSYYIYCVNLTVINTQVKYIGYSGVEGQNLNPFMGTVVGLIEGNGVVGLISVSGSSINYGSLDSAYKYGFLNLGRYNQRQYAGNGTYQGYGKITNGTYIVG